KSVVTMPPLPNVGSRWPACAAACWEAMSRIEKINNTARFNVMPYICFPPNYLDPPGATSESKAYLTASLTTRGQEVVTRLSPDSQKTVKILQRLRSGL